MDQLNLLQPFMTYAGFQSMMERLLPALTNFVDDPNAAAVAFFALEGLYHIEENVKSCQFVHNDIEAILTFLRKWRCESPLGAYRRRKERFLRNLATFKTLEVPLFIDDYGDKRLMSHYQTLANQYNPNDGEPPQGNIIIQQLEIDPNTIAIENIDINLDTPIVHVTHSEEKGNIVREKRFKASANKNSIEGVWFSPKSQLGDPPNMSSVYGKWAFETTLRKLDVAEIRQGEIVSYNQEVNFILYASDTEPQDPALRKATDNTVKVSQNDRNAYAAVSIFVPGRFLPKQGEEFLEVVERPYEVSHQPFCVKERRNVIEQCEDLIEN